MLSNNVLDENNGIWDVIWTLTWTDDWEDTNTLTYALSCSVAWADDSSFSISWNSLNAWAVYDYETQNTYNICVQVSDWVLTYDENFIITINDLDEVPPVVTITPWTKLQNSAITDTTVVITDDIWVNLSDVDSTWWALSCTQTSSIQVDCTSNIPVSGDLIVNALDTSSNAWTATEPNYIVDIIPPNIPNVSVDTSSWIDTPTVTFSSLDNVAVDYYTVTYTSATGILTTINPATSPVDLVLDSSELVHTIVVTAYDTAGNSSASTIKFPPIVTINAPTTLSNTTITDSTVTITSPPGNDLTNIMLVTSTTWASLGTCTWDRWDTTDPYATPVICDINGISDSGSISILAEDASNWAEWLNSQSYIIDTTPPVITITAPTKLDNTSITDTTITVIDETAVTSANVVIDGTTSLTSSAYSCIQINPSQVNCTISIDTSGDLVISATDNAGNNDLENEDSYIIDTLPPVLTLVWNDPETVEYLASYSDAWADFTDNIDGTGSVVWVWTVNTWILWSYPINYNYTDTAGNPATQISRTVNVVDTTPPVISIIGNAIETVEVNTSYTDAWASSTDNYDGNLTTSIVATDNIDITNIWSYTVNYDVVDTNWNVATTVTRTVNVVDTTPPVISLVWLDEIILEVWSTYTEQWATVNDNYETLLPTNITIDSSAVNTSVLWTYSVTYNISDSSWNAAIEVIREVTVQDTTIPVISLVWNNPETIEVHSTYSDAWATALDNYDGDISGNISSVVSVNTAVLWSNTVTYDVIDSSSNAAIQATRTVNVVDTTDPVITLNGASTITQEVGSTYTDLWAGVSDNFDVNSNVVATWVVDTNTVWSYTLTYNHTDSSGNTAINNYKNSNNWRYNWSCDYTQLT